MINNLKKILLFLFLVFLNLTVVEADSTVIKTCKYEKNDLGSINTIYVELKYQKSCPRCSMANLIDKERSYYKDSEDGKFYKFSDLATIGTLQVNHTNPEKYRDENKDNCPEAMFVGVRDGNWVTLNFGTKSEMQKVYDNNMPTGGYDYRYRDRYIVDVVKGLTEKDFEAIDKRFIEQNKNLNDKYSEYEAKMCPPFAVNVVDDLHYLDKWREQLKIKGKSNDDINKLLEECSTLKNNLKVLISSAESDLKDQKNHGYPLEREPAKKLQETINKIKNIKTPSEDEFEVQDPLGDVLIGCEVIPKTIRKWINNILNFVKYVALVLVIALGALDFMKAAGSGEGDAMKKAGQSFLKRLIAVVILFLLPLIVELILNLVNIYGVDPDNINCMK